MDPPRRCGDPRNPDPGPADPGLARPPRTALAVLAGRGGGPPGGLPGLARRGDGPPRQQRRIGDRPPGQRDGPPRSARLHPGPELLPGPRRRPGCQPALHPAGGLRGGDDLRPPALRLARHRDHQRGARLPGLAADGRHALPGDHRRRLGPGPAPLRRGDRGPDRGRHRTDRLADATRPPGDGAPGAGRRGPPADRGRGRRPAGADPALGLVADAARGPRGLDLVGAGRPDRRCLLHRPDGAGADRRAARPGGRFRLRDCRSAPGRRVALAGRRRPARLGCTRLHLAGLGQVLHRPDQAPDHRAPAGHHRAGDGPRHPRRCPGSRSGTGPGWSSGR